MFNSDEDLTVSRITIMGLLYSGHMAMQETFLFKIRSHISQTSLLHYVAMDALGLLISMPPLSPRAGLPGMHHHTKFF